MVVKAEREQSHLGTFMPHLEKDRTLSGNSEKMSKQYRKFALHPTSLILFQGAKGQRGEGGREWNQLGLGYTPTQCGKHVISEKRKDGKGEGRQRKKERGREKGLHFTNI